jgi:hypothetical protein
MTRKIMVLGINVMPLKPDPGWLESFAILQEFEATKSPSNF